MGASTRTDYLDGQPTLGHPPLMPDNPPPSGQFGYPPVPPVPDSGGFPAYQATINEPSAPLLDPNMGAYQPPAYNPYAPQATVTHPQVWQASSQQYVAPPPAAQPPTYAEYQGLPAGGGQGPVLVEHSVTVTSMSGPPELINCGVCGYVGPAVPKKEVGFITVLMSTMLCFIGCPWCFCLPCFTDCGKDTVYRCPRCETEIRRQRL